MMHIPIYGRHTGHAANLTNILNANRNIVENAEPIPRIWLGMVAGRAHKRVAVVNFAIQNGIYQCQQPTGGKASDVVAAFGKGGVASGIPAVRLAQRLNMLDIPAGMHPRQIVLGCHARFDAG